MIYSDKTMNLVYANNTGVVLSNGIRVAGASFSSTHYSCVFMLESNL